MSTFIEETERHLLRTLDDVSLDALALRGFIAREPMARQVFALDAEGRRIHPPPEGDLSEAEQQFIERATHLWNRNVFYHLEGPAHEGSSPPASVPIGAPTVGEGKATRTRSGGARPYGWHVWYWGRGLNLIFWRRLDSGQVVGVEIDRVRLASDLIGELPETDDTEPLRPQGRIALADSQGDTLYQWGAYEPAEGEAPRVGLPLRHPLSAWKLEYFVPEAALDAGLGRSVLFNVLSGVIVIFLALMGLAVYFYRESSRDMREAQQRMTFVNRVSHELRTPLTNIRMYAELLQESLAEGEEKNSRYIGVLVSESERLSRLIANVLTFGRKQDQRLTLRKSPGVVDEVLLAALAQFAPSMEAKGIAVTVSGDAEAEVLLDGDALQQILGNLFSNVEKYAASGESMTVQSEQDGDWTTIKVSDKGPGIPHANRDRIFEPFYRISDKLTGGVAGTGIGLSIARDLAHLHGGDLVLVPTASGACFRLTLQTPRVGADEGTRS